MNSTIKTDNEFQHHIRINKDVVDRKYFKEFGDRYLQYRKLWSKSGINYLPDFPIHLDVEVIDACNFFCPYCWRNTDNGFANQEAHNPIKVVKDELARF